METCSCRRVNANSVYNSLYRVSDFIEGDESFGELWNEIGAEGIVGVLAVCTLSGIIISALVFLFVQQRRFRNSASAIA